MSKERIGGNKVKCTACNSAYTDTEEHVCQPVDYDKNPLEGREPQYEDSMYMIVYALIGSGIAWIVAILYFATR